MYSWEKEKAYNAHRAAAAAAEMEEAIRTIDIPRFTAAYQVALRYMNKKPRSEYYRRMLAAANVAQKAQ